MLAVVVLHAVGLGIMVAWEGRYFGRLDELCPWYDDEGTMAAPRSLQGRLVCGDSGVSGTYWLLVVGAVAVALLGELLGSYWLGALIVAVAYLATAGVGMTLARRKARPAPRATDAATPEPGVRSLVKRTFREIGSDWSADSRWLAYTKVIKTNFRQVYLYSVAEKKSYPLTDGLSDATEPKFDPGGKYLYFFASTDAGPVLNWFDQSSADMRMSNALYLVTLQKETMSPLAKENDEERGTASPAADDRSARRSRRAGSSRRSRPGSPRVLPRCGRRRPGRLHTRLPAPRLRNAARQ